MSGDDELDDDYVEDGWDHDDPVQEAFDNCSGGYYGPGGTFSCMAAGSEDCEFECPFNKLIGTRNL